MTRPFTHLRRMVFGASCVIVFGFGATQALALRADSMDAPLHCWAAPGEPEPWECVEECLTRGGGGYCDVGTSTCKCRGEQSDTPGPTP